MEINYSEEGIIITSTTWESDVKNGEEIRYFESGEIQHVTYFTEGKRMVNVDSTLSMEE